MLTQDVVLFNDCGCEIAREAITSNRTESDIINSWIICPGDHIEVVDVFVEM